ncbi:MAG: hypothetical protein AAF639_08910 [Chloroflexota bacterium]
MSTRITRTHPRISINKLGEYVTARPRRRRRVIHDQKYPPTFQVTRYNQAQSAMTKFLANAGEDKLIHDTIEALANAEPKSTWDAERMRSCSKALDSFLEFYKPAMIEGYEVEAGDPHPPKLEVAGVQISVRPDLILRGTDRKGNPTVGAIKLYIAKTKPLDEESGLIIATSVHQYIEHVSPEGTKAPLKASMVVDVFAQKIYHAPRSYISRRKDIEAACEEVARAWSTA